MLILKENLQKSSVMNDLRRRVKQQLTHKKEHLTQLDKVQCRCMNSSSLEWSDSFRLIHEKENAGEAVGQILSAYQLFDAGQILQEHLFVNLYIANQFDISCEQQSHVKLVDQLLTHFPIMSISDGSSFVVLANLHEFIMYPSALVNLLEMRSTPSPAAEPHSLTTQPHSLTTQPLHSSTTEPLSQLSLTR